MKFGIRDGLLRQPLDSVFNVAADIGFDGVEVCIGKNYADSLLWRPDGPETLAGYAEAAGIEVSSLSPGVFGSCNPSLPDEQKRAEGRTIMTHVIRTCAALGVSDILVPMFPRDVTDWPQQTWDRLCNGFRRLADTAEELQVNLDLETTFTADQLLRIIDTVASDRIKVYYDTANTTNLGYDIEAELRQLGEHVVMVHAKDTDGNMLGQGQVDFDGAAAALRDIGYDNYIVLETRPGDDPQGNAARNLEFVKTLTA